MACRRLCRQMIASAPPRRQRSTAAEVSAGCPFHFREGLERPFGHTKPYECIPTPKGLPLVGTVFDMMKSGGAAKIHEYCDRRHRELGPIFREKLGAVEAVAVADKDYISTVYSSEGRYPSHMVPEPWLMYNQRKGNKRGLFFMDGSQWLDRRKILNHSLLSPQEISKYSGAFSGVVRDVLDRWETLAKRNKDLTVPNLENELYNWSIETLGTIVFGRRLQCVTPPEQESEMHEFVYYVQKIFGESAKMQIIPPKLAAALRLPVWRRFVDAADNALRMARDYTIERIAEIQSNKSNSEFHGVLGQLLAHGNIDETETVNIVADLILAAADTTSHATQWALYLLARNPECQEKLLEQINSVVPPGEEVKQEHLDHIPYAMWIIKETLRLYPIASFLTRILPKDIVLGEYEVPAGKLIIMSQYTMGRNPDHFPEPDRFEPQRWYRPLTGEHRNLSQGCMPFGAGVRSCIGKRMAELKMRLLLTNLVQKFRLESANKVGVAMRMITTPDKPISIRLQKRNP